MERRRLIAGRCRRTGSFRSPHADRVGRETRHVRMCRGGYTSVTIETDDVKYKHFFVRSAKPLRLVIDIEGLALTERIKKLIAAVNPDDPYIQSMRIGQYQARALCVWLWISKRT